MVILPVGLPGPVYIVFLNILAKNWRFAPNFARLASLAGLFASLTIWPLTMFWYTYFDNRQRNAQI